MAKVKYTVNIHVTTTLHLRKYLLPWDRSSFSIYYLLTLCFVKIKSLSCFFTPAIAMSGSWGALNLENPRPISVGLLEI